MFGFSGLARARHSISGIATATLVVAGLGVAGVPGDAPAVGAPPADRLAQPTRVGYLNAVTSTGPDDVWAVGYERVIGSGGATQSGLIEHWDGSEWSRQPFPKRFDPADLNTAVEIAPDDLWVGGSIPTGQTGDTTTFVANWDGMAWRRTPTPNGEAGANNAVWALAAAGPDDVWAVGTLSGPGGAGLPLGLCLHWGADHHWADAGCEMPAKGAQFDAAAASDTGRAVIGGVVDKFRRERHIVDSYDPSGGWTRQDVPHIGFVLSLSMDSSGTEWALGDRQADDRQSPITRDDGSGWVRAPRPAGYLNLQAISMDSPTDGWAVGGPTGLDDPMAYHWTGSSWTAVTVDADVLLWQVDALGPADAWAVGSSVSEQPQPVIGHWDGSSWTVTIIPL